MPLDSRLQFGHGGDAVETDVAARYDDRERRRFNSATALTPWRRTGRLVG